MSIDHVKFIRKVAATASIKELLGASFPPICSPCVVPTHTGPELNPGPDVVSDEQIAMFVKTCMSTTFRTFS